MKTEKELITYHDNVKKAKAETGPGPWQQETDIWEQRLEHIPYFIIRHPQNLFWKAFAGVDSEHPLYKNEAWNCAVHKGITYYGLRIGTITSDWDKQNDPLWWFGIDFNAPGDMIPSLNRLYTVGNFKKADYIEAEHIYRSQDYAMEAARTIAKHLYAAEVPLSVATM